MTNRIDSQIDDMHELIKTMEREQRRKRAEANYGPIRTWHTAGPKNSAIEAYFDNYLDYDMPGWARGFGATEAEAMDDLLNNAEEHYAEQLDEKRLAELERQSGCSDA